MFLIRSNPNYLRPRALLLALALLLAPLLGLAPTPALAAEPTPDCTTSDGISTCTITFDYSGAPATWTVPAGVTTATFDLYGAQGGGGTLGGAGGRITATLGVSQGDSYQIQVGGQNGYNGGGAGGVRGLGTTGYNGGGASDVRSGSFALGNRLLVAGGGGGGTRGQLGDEASGGAGGYPSGASGAAIPPYCDGAGGAGGTQSEGGPGGGYNFFGAGDFGQGGEGQNDDYGSGGGGGGGYYGGGGGDGCFYGGGGGGGGGSYATTAATDVSYENGVREGDGLVSIIYTLPDNTVAYRWSGFFQPIDSLPTVNSVKAGQAIPVKFSLGGNYGLKTFAAGYPMVQTVACASGAATDEVEQTVTAGASGLSYDVASGQYSYTWKTDKKWAGSCRLLILKLADGTDHIAGFQLR